jgi:hypothetical protein
MGRLKQEYTIDFEPRYGLACELEGHALADEDVEAMYDQYSESICVIDDRDLL